MSVPEARRIRRLWGMCAAFGGAVLVLSVVIFSIFPSEGGDYDKGYGAPVYAFEMARSPEDLHKVFGPPDDPQHASRVAAMDRGNRWDYLFMTLYGGFIATFFVAAHAERPGPSLRWAVGLGVLAAAADATENAILLGLTKDLANAPNLEWLTFPVWIKFAALIVAAGVAGSFLLKAPGRGSRPLGVLTLAAAASCLLGVASPSRLGWVLGTGLGVCWTAQLVFVVLRLRRSRNRQP